MRARVRIACLMYHEVTDDPGSTGFQRSAARTYVHSMPAFRAHLDSFAALGQTPVLITSIDPQRSGKHLVLTFDDGGCSAVSVARELDRRGWPGHFFVITGRCGTRGFLDVSQIRAIRASGHAIGTHSHTHPDIFPELSAARMLEEWRISCDVLQNALGEPCIMGSVPGGDLSDAVIETASQAGIQMLFTSEPWLVPRRMADCWVYGRFGVKAGHSPQLIRELGQQRGWGRALLVRTIKHVARRSVPPLYRLYVQMRTREDGTALAAPGRETTTGSARAANQNDSELPHNEDVELRARARGTG